MKIVIGTDEDNKIVAGCVILPNINIDADIAEMVREGLTVKIIEAKSVTIGKYLDQTEYSEVSDGRQRSSRGNGKRNTLWLLGW